MIIEVPDPEDFARASINLLNLAWEIAIQSLEEFQQSEMINLDDEEFEWFVSQTDKEQIFRGSQASSIPDKRVAVTIEFWRRSQPSLGNALSLIQQAVELGLKGRIARVSPFLLIARDARDYPRGNDRADVPFSSFRTLDAADLVKVHNTVCAERLDDEFAGWWEAIRRQRNALIHSVQPGAKMMHPEDILAHVFQANHSLFFEKNWFARRTEYLYNNATNVAYEVKGRYIYGRVFEEFSAMLDTPTKHAALKYLNYKIDASSYHCVHCRDDGATDLIYPTAQLSLDSEATTVLQCVVCQRASRVFRRICPAPGCGSSVLSAEADHLRTCLVCLKEWGS